MELFLTPLYYRCQGLSTPGDEVCPVGTGELSGFSKEAGTNSQVLASKEELRRTA